MRKLLLSLLLVLNAAWALPVEGGDLGGGSEKPLDEVIWPIGS